MPIIDGRIVYSYHVSRFAKAGLLYLTEGLCRDDAYLRRGRSSGGEYSILPLVAAIGSGRFTVSEEPDRWIAEELRQQTAESIRREVGADVERAQREIGKKERGWISICEPELAGINSIALQLGYVRRRTPAPSGLLEAIGVGRLSILPTLDLRYRELYLSNHPLVREYIELVKVVKLDRYRSGDAG